MADFVGSEPEKEFTAIITDRTGRVMLSFELKTNERYLLSSLVGEITSKKIAKDEHIWSRDTLTEIIREMTPKN